MLLLSSLPASKQNMIREAIRNLLSFGHICKMHQELLSGIALLGKQHVYRSEMVLRGLLVPQPSSDDTVWKMLHPQSKLIKKYSVVAFLVWFCTFALFISPIVLHHFLIHNFFGYKRMKTRKALLTLYNTQHHKRAFFKTAIHDKQ